MLFIDFLKKSWTIVHGFEIVDKSDFVGGNGINIPPISVGSENSEGRVCVRLFLRSAASEPDTDWNCEL